MADNELYFKIVVDNKAAKKEVESFSTSIKGIGKVNLTASKNALGQIGESVGESSKAAQLFSNAFSEIQKGAPALRYAMYDIRNSMLSIAAAATALAVTPIGLSIQYERNFANVIRTNELAANSFTDLKEQLRRDLLEIAQTTPISWEDVTNIATLAGQLGVARQDIANFTETVAKFAATTDLTVDAAATAFGRLDQLIDGVDGRFENLGSAILAVGVDSVATESQIVNVSTQIASMGNLAGLTAPEIVGLSGAIASLGIRPELARGNVTRLFSRIGQAAAEGGFKVAEFGRLTGRTAEEFVEDWGTRPGRVLQDFFDGINAEGPRAERTLRELGITSVRDIPALLRLAQNSDEVRRLIALSSDEYIFGTKVTEQYGIISGTTAEQIARLGQNFQTLGAAVGDSIGPLSALFQFTNLLVQGLTRLVQTPIGQFFSGVGIIFALVTAAITGLVAIVAGAVASFLAYRFASDKLGISLKSLVFSAFQSKAAIDAVSTSAKTGAASVALLGNAMRLAFITTGIGVAITVITLALASFGNQTDESEEKINRFFGSMDNLREAIDKDTEAFDELTGKMKDGSDAILVYQRATTTASASIESTVSVAEDFVDAQGKIVTATKEATSEIENQTRAVGENTLAFLAGSLTQDADIVSLLASPEFQEAFRQSGKTINELIAAGIEGTADPIIDALIATQQTALDALNRQISVLEDYGDITGADQDRYVELTKAAQTYEDVIANLDGALRDQLDATREAIEADREYEQVTQDLVQALGEQGIFTNLSKDAINELMDEIFGGINASRRMRDSFEDLGEEFANLEGGALTAEGAIQDVIQSILEGTLDPETQIANLAQTMVLLQAAGLGSAAVMEALEGAIDGVAIRSGIGADKLQELIASAGLLSTLEGVPEALAAGMEKIGTSSGGAAEKVKTLAEQFDELTDSIFGPVNAAQSAAQSIADLGEAYAELGQDAFFASDEIQDAVSNILATSGSAEEGVANLNALYAQLAQTVGSDTAPSLAFLRNTINQVAQQFGVAQDAVAGFANIDLSFFNRGVRAASEEIRTLLDYANDLEGVISRAFDIRFASTFDIDRIAEAWFELGNQVEDARYQVEELIASQSDLGADRALKEYFLSVAEAYDDQLRAAQLRREIAELDREQARNARELTEAQQVAGGDLTTQGPGGRQNRAALLDLVQNYQDYITTLAESGASQDELRQATSRAREEFIEQARELGFQEEVVLQYAEAFDDVAFAINNVPRNITVDANVNPAVQALNELNAKLNESIDLARELNRVQSITPPPPAPPGQTVTTISGATEKSLSADLAALNAAIANPTSSQARNAAIDSKRWTLRALQYFDQGGFTGRGARMEPAGIVHRGEYVIPKQYVNQSTGMPDPSFLAQLQNGMRGYQVGGFVGGPTAGGDGSVMVELSPYDRKLLENAGNVQLRLNGRVVAEATNQNNFNQARRGSD